MQGMHSCPACVWFAVATSPRQTRERQFGCTARLCACMPLTRSTDVRVVPGLAAAHGAIHAFFRHEVAGITQDSVATGGTASEIRYTCSRATAAALRAHASVPYMHRISCGMVNTAAARRYVTHLARRNVADTVAIVPAGLLQLVLGARPAGDRDRGCGW